MGLQDSVQRSLQNPAEKYLQICIDSQRSKTWELRHVVSSFYLSNTSGYYLSLTNRSDHEDQINRGNLSVPNIQRSIFEQIDNKKPSFTFCCCSSRAGTSLIMVFSHSFKLIEFFVQCSFLTRENDDSLLGPFFICSKILINRISTKHHCFPFCGGASWFWQDTSKWRDDLQSENLD